MLYLSSFVYGAGIQQWDSCMVDGVPTLQCLEIVFGNLLTISSGFIVLILFIMLVVGGFNYLSSFGDAEKIKKAQATIRFAIIGFILFIASFLILRIIDIMFLGGQGKLFQFDLTIN